MTDPDYERRFLSQHNPFTSPQKQTTPVKCRGDRYIPIRSPDEWAVKFASLETRSIAESSPNSTSRTNLSSQINAAATSAAAAVASSTGSNRVVARVEEQRPDSAAFRALLRNELLGEEIEDLRPDANVAGGSGGKSRSLFQYGRYQSRSPAKCDFTTINPYSLSPLSPSSQKLLRSPRKAARKISRVPYKVLDAPELQDDFYLNLVDWSAKNILSVGLASSVYLWSACTSQVVKLCDLSTSDNDSVTSVGWCERGDYLSVGTQRGLCHIYDVTANKRVQTLEGHSSRIGCLAWNGTLVCTGSRDRLIIQQDTRTPAVVSERRLAAHKQEVCGLKWSPDHQYLASGGNDNQLLVWSLRSPKPVQAYVQHVAAVKAIAWSPHHHGLLVSGGGTADRCMKFWNTLTGQPMHSIDTGSQVCNITWSKHSCELVSTHGYSQNQIIVWQYPSLQQVAKLTGHSYRVLYLAMSPDGESIVTGAGDETLRFWRVFDKQKSHREVRSALNLFTSLR